MKVVKYNLINASEREKIINQTINFLKKGGMVVFPTDTVYGILVDATNKKAVGKLIEFKNRPAGKAISIFVNDKKMLMDEAEISFSQIQMIDQLLPGPFTLIFKSRHQIVKELESENGTLGIRLPDYKLILDLVKKFKRPVTATSANLAGRSPHYSVNSLLNSLSKVKTNFIDLIVDTGLLPRNKPSTVVDMTGPSIKLLRMGDTEFSQSKTYITYSPLQTKKTAKNILEQFFVKKANKPLIIIIEGELGVGKTVLVKGIGDLFNIKNIISPTYVVFYEYDIKSRKTYNFKKLIHIDLYNVQEKNEFRYLHLEKYLEKGNILCIEWGEKSGELINLFKEKAIIIGVKMKYLNQNKRLIKVNNKLFK